MGTVIAKRNDGMNWTAKVSLVLICTLLTTMFMYQGWFKPERTPAAISTASWTTIYNSTTYPTAASVAYSIPAGPNRLLVVAVSSTRSTVGAQTFTLTYGSQSLTSQVGDQASTTPQQHTAIFYLKEAGIAAATSSNFSLTVSGGTSVYTSMNAAVFTGVDQTTPFTNSQNYTSGVSTTGTPIFATALTENAGDQPVVIINSTRTGNSTARTVTASTNWTIPTNGNNTGGSGTGVRGTVLVRTQPSANTSDTTGGTITGGNTLASMSGVSIKSAAGGPVVTSLTPNVNIGAGATTVTINGTGLTGATAVSVSDTLVTAGAPTVVDDTQITVPVTAATGAAPGARTVTVTTGVAVSAAFTATGFIVSSAPAPLVTSISPNVIGAGATSQTITITGDNFVSGTGLAANFGTNVTTNSTTFVDAQHITANVTVATSVTAGTRNVIVTNPDTQTGTGTGLLTVNARATVTSASPATGAQGATNLNVTITGTNFIAGAPLAAVFSGTGITVNSTTYVDATHITANVAITAGATIGARTITVTNGDTGVSAASGSIFTVFNPTAIYITSVSPTTIGQGATNVLMHIYGSNFVNGATISMQRTGGSSSRITLVSSGTSSGATTFIDSTHLTVLVNVSTSSVSAHDVTITNPDTTTFQLLSALSTTAAPTITSIAPTSMLQGTGADITITGTGFQTGATVSFPGTSSGITLSNVVITSATSITAHVDTTASATLGVQTVTVANPDFGKATTTFNVFSATAPTLTSMTPATIGQAATALNVDVYGTNFDASIASPGGLNFGSGVTTNSVTFVDATHLKANITLSTSATAGAHVVTVTNPNLEAGTGSILTVTARPGSASISPTTGSLGTTFDVAITSSGLAAGPGFDVTVSGTGVTVNTHTLNSATSVTANVSIDSSYLVAPLGARTLTLSNGDYGVRTATLTIRGGAPTVISASPAIKQGAVAQDVTITGTNFYPGATVTFSNTGVAVGSVTFVDNNTLKANVTLTASATTGISNITVTNSDTQTATGTGIFTVTSGPTVTSNTPTRGGQGSTLDVTINGTVFDSGAAVIFSDTGITVNSVTGSGSTLIANISIDPAALKTTRSITVTNPDGSSSAGGSFDVILPVTTTVGALSFSKVTASSITVTAAFTNDSNSNNGCIIKWGTSDGSYPNSATAIRGTSGYSATVSGLTGGADGAGKAYYFQATFTDADGIVGTAILSGLQATKASDLMHDSLNISSAKWDQGWGTDGGKYGAFSCSTCHAKNTTNNKLVAGTVTAPMGTWSSSTTNSLTVEYTGTLGVDGAHATSTNVCEACHSRTNHHRFNNGGANHMGNEDCLKCHSHKESFMPTCIECHSTAQGTNSSRRKIIGNGGDFFTNMSSHGKSTVKSLSCNACHDSVNHRTYSDGTSVLLKNADGGASALYDGTPATAVAVKNTCISCHDADGAKVMGTNATTPFAGSGDMKSPANISQYWPATGSAHETKMVCFNCHGNSKGVDGSTTNPSYNGHASGNKHVLQDPGYDVVNPNNYCFNCHNAASTNLNKSSKDIAGEMAKANKHTTAKCFDCHGDEANSIDSMHSLRSGSQAAGSGLIANNISNATGRSMTWSAASWGGATASVNLASNTVSSEYQICFKCHATTGTGITPASPYNVGTAAAALTNLALEFNPNNASRHPVGSALAASNRLTSAKLAGGWTPGQVMTCSDCHATDTAASKGPHGSSVKWMLAGTNKAWPYTTAAGNGGSTGTLFRVATYNTGVGTKDGLFCLNCHTVTGSNNWHSYGDVTGGEHGGNAIMACASCHIRVPHGGKISRLLQTTNAPARYRSNGSTATSSFDIWGSAVNIKGSSFSSANFNSSCSQHNNGGVGGEAW